MRVLVITGAGISAESGIPTFRGQNGYWRNLDPMKLATPEAFARNPKLVWEWYRERREWIRKAQPNAAHKAVVALSDHANDFLLVTQNVDDLHVRAELETTKMVQIHGDIFETRCSCCGFLGDEQEVEVPKCPKCDGLMRPGVVWFGEQLDSKKIDTVEHFLGQGGCDLVFVIGTTALFGYIIDWALRGASDGGELIEVNPAETELSEFATRLVRKPAASALPSLVDSLIRARQTP